MHRRTLFSAGIAGALAGLAALGVSAVAVAGETFIVAPESPDVIGVLASTTAVYEDTISDLALAYSQGYREMRIANPGVDPWLPGEGTPIIVPSLYVLPSAPRSGIVINVPEMRLYLYAKAARGAPQQVTTYPISIGRQQWDTPKGATTVVAKVKNPAWYPPESIRKEHAANGDPLPLVVPPGPANPLGSRALRLGLPGYLIHGTDKPFGIGMRVTHGCIRLYPRDAEAIFELTNVGTAVRIVNEPFKVGLSQGQVLLEVHPHLEEDQAAFADQYSHVVKLLLARGADYSIHLVWTDIRRALETRNGIPQIVGSYRPKTIPATSAALETRLSAAP